MPSELRLNAAQARTLLFVPGKRPDRFDKALGSGADAVVLDLEDSVPASDKPAAREAIGARWAALLAADQRPALIVRINSPALDAGRDDIAWLARLAPPEGVMVPKADGSACLAEIAARMPGAAIFPIIESAAGYAALAEVAAAPGVLRLVVGHIDFMADSGIACSDDQNELAPLRFAVAMATRLHRLAPAVDGVTTALDDDEALRQDTRRALRFGFAGKLCIHPRQIAVVHGAMAPTGADIDWARRVLAADAAAGGAAVQLDGRMVDLPVVLRARQTLARLAGPR